MITPRLLEQHRRYEAKNCQVKGRDCTVCAQNFARSLWQAWSRSLPSKRAGRR